MNLRPSFRNVTTRALAEPRWRRVDRQLIAMIDEAREKVEHSGPAVSARVLLTGFSAEGSFVRRFELLHPERVLAVAAGAPGGWQSATLPW